MAQNIHGIVMRTVPWVAVAVMTVFAFSQLAERRRLGERVSKLEQAPPPRPAAGPAAPAAMPESPPGKFVPRTLALKLDEQLLEARERGVALEKELAAVRAELARVTEARDRQMAVGAALRAQAEVARGLQAQLEVLQAKLEELETQRARRQAVEKSLDQLAADETRVLAWIDALLGDDEAARKVAQAQARTATPEALSALTRRVIAGAPIERVRDAIPHLQGGGRDNFVALVLIRGRGALREHLDALGVEHVVRQPVLMTILGATAGHCTAADVETIGRELLSWLAANANPADEKQRAVLTRVGGGLLRTGEPAEVARGARAIGLLRLEGFVPRLTALLGDDDVRVQAAAAYGLYRAPDLDEVAAEVAPIKDALWPLLASDEVEVRTAASLLGSRVFDPFDYNPLGSADERKMAILRLRAGS